MTDLKPNPPRRIVTGHNDAGKAIIQEDGFPPRKQRIGGEIGPWFYEVWNTQETPVKINAQSGEPNEEGIVLAPPKNGTRIRVLDIPPDGDNFNDLSAEDAAALFSEISASDASEHAKGGDTKHAIMHRTETVDYGLVLKGEIVLIMDEGETLCRAGDIIVQRGTNHAWANRSDQTCRIAFILVDGTFDPEIA